MNQKLPDYENYALSHPYFVGSLERLPNLAEALAAVPGGTFAEVGCGDGGRLKSLMEDGALSHFNNVLAFDISELRVSRTQELVPGATVVVSGAESLPLDAESIDFAFSDQVIEHVPSDQLMVLELHRVLRLGGTAFVGSVVKKKFAFYFYRKNGEWRLDPTHIREYPSAAHMALLFETNGFSIDGIFERAIAYSARDLVTRLISRVCGLDSARAAKAYEVLSPLAHVRIRVPGYYHCWVRCRRI